MFKSEKIILDDEDYIFRLEDLSEYTKLKENHYIFKVNGEGLYSEFNYEIVNPSSDQVFKRLFILYSSHSLKKF